VPKQCGFRLDVDAVRAFFVRLMLDWGATGGISTGVFGPGRLAAKGVLIFYECWCDIFRLI